MLTEQQVLKSRVEVLKSRVEVLQSPSQISTNKVIALLLRESLQDQAIALLQNIESKFDTSV
jgi:hypothetical protein